MLTESRIKALKPTGKRSVVWDSVLPGHGIRVTETGHRSFVVARTLAGTRPKLVWVTLGQHPLMTLEQARDAAREALGLLARGIHPKEAMAQRRQEQDRQRQDTFGAVAETFLALHVARLRTSREVTALIRQRLIARWSDLPLASVTRRDVVTLLDELRGQPHAARHTLSAIRRLYSWAIERGVYGIEASPCDRLRASSLIGAVASRDRVLSDAELRSVWQATARLGPPHRQFLRILLLTGQRRREIANASWGEIDGDMLVIPAARMKAGIAHTAPLTRAVLDELAMLPRGDGPFIFSTTGGRRPISGFSFLKNQIDALTGPLPPWSFHDLRRTVRTRMAMLGVPAIHAEMVIAHRQQGIHAVYDRHSYDAEIRAALDKWERVLLAIVGEAPAGGAVVPFPRSA